jgi:ribokinase
LVIGSANVDIVVPVPKLPARGETVVGGEREEFWGGKGANQAVAARKAGAKVRIVASMGKDSYGAAYRKYLVEMGIERRGLFAVPGPTGTALIVVDSRGANQIAVSPGANAFLAPALIKKRKGVLEFGEVVLAQLEVSVSTVEAAFRAAKQRGAITVLNPAPASNRFPAKLISLTDVLIPNETEAASLCGLKGCAGDSSELVRLCKLLRKKCAGAVVLTAGSKGAYVSSEKEQGWVRPPKSLHVVDTTGAGDTFCGALAARLAQKASLIEAVHFAVAAASISIQKVGAQTGIPSKRAILNAIEGTRLEGRFPG